MNVLVIFFEYNWSRTIVIVLPNTSNIFVLRLNNERSYSRSLKLRLINLTIQQI